MRVRVHFLAALLAVVSIALGMLLLNPGPVTAAPTISRSVAPRPAPERCTAPAPTTAAGYQAMFDAKNDDGWSGGDQAASLALADGRVLWLFADTVQGAQRGRAYQAGSRMVHNSFLLQDGGCLTAVNGPNRTELIPNHAGGDWYWPVSALVERGRLLVVVARTTRTGPGSLDFRSVGSSVAVFTLGTGTPVFERLAAMPTTDAEYGAALAAQGGWTYVYGTNQVSGAFGRAVTLARVPSGSFLEPSAWRYWSGRQWTADPARAALVVEAAPHGWSTSFSVVAQDGGFRFLTKVNDYLGSTVASGTSGSALPPKVLTAVASYPSKQPGEVFYNPLAHPEAHLRGGGLLVTICRNNLDPRRVQASADLYKPQFFTVR